MCIQQLQPDFGSLMSITSYMGAGDACRFAQQWQRQRPAAVATSAADIATPQPQGKVMPARPPKSVVETPVEAALTDFCHALFNANEFCYVE